MSIYKYYPSMLTQFIIGCTCYVISFFIIKDIISLSIYEKYKYHIMALLMIDTSFLLYKHVYPKKNSKIFGNNANVITSPTRISEVTSDIKTTSQQSISFVSEIDDFKITHDISSSDTDYELFSSSTSDKPNKLNKPDNPTGSINADKNIASDEIKPHNTNDIEETGTNISITLSSNKK
jgi:hypothetical protein